ncbi:MAG: winged-helix domain-containing protein [Candidatus Methylacidiphilaceae bacterium]
MIEPLPSRELQEKAKRLFVFLLPSSAPEMNRLAAFLRDANLRTEILTDPEKAIERIGQVLLPAVLLPWPLASPQEKAFLLRLRKLGSWVPLLAIGQGKDAACRIQALESGADFFVETSGAEGEVLAILGSIVRRCERDSSAKLGSLPFALDAEKRLLRRGDREVALTPTEFAILSYLLRHAGRIVPAEELATKLPRRRGRGTTPPLHLLQVHLVSLRKKLSQAAMGSLLRAVRGKGLVLEWERPNGPNRAEAAARSIAEDRDRARPEPRRLEKDA